MSERPGEPESPGSDSGSAAPEPELTPEEIADSTGDRYWSVDDCPWSAVCPTLPDDLIELLAPPVLVGATPLADEGAGGGPSARG